MCATTGDPVLSVAQIVTDTVVDGPGIRTAIYGAGCTHCCPGCHNPQTWDIRSGTPRTIDEILQAVQAGGHTGITFTGGDPMYQAAAFAALARRIREEPGKNIWCYTGYLYEQVVASARMSVLLPYIDVMVDGPFIESGNDPGLLFRGSDNQRLIDVPRSLRSGKTVLFDYAPFPVF